MVFLSGFSTEVHHELLHPRLAEIVPHAFVRRRILKYSRVNVSHNIRTDPLELKRFSSCLLLPA